MLFNKMCIFCLVLERAIYEINLKRHCENVPNNKKKRTPFCNIFVPVVAAGELAFTCL